MPTAKNGRIEVAREIGNAQGFRWLLRYMQGETIAGISRADHRNPITVNKYMKRAANLMVDAAQESIMQDIIPLAKRLLQVHLEKQIERAEKGDKVELDLVERIMKSMYVFDSPQLKDTVTASDGQEVETLAAFLVKRPTKQLKQPNPLTLVEGEVEDRKDGDKDNPPTDT